MITNEILLRLNAIEDKQIMHGVALKHMYDILYCLIDDMYLNSDLPDSVREAWNKLVEIVKSI